MSNSFDMTNFLAELGINEGVVTNQWELTYKNLVLWEYGIDSTVFPIKVLQILETPRGPTDFQKWVIGSIVPYVEDVEDWFSIALNTWRIHSTTPETLAVYPYGYVNSILLACLDDLAKWRMESAVMRAQYIQAIFPYLSTNNIWTLSPERPSSESPFARFGSITTPDQLQDPYGNQDSIFLSNLILPEKP